MNLGIDLRKSGSRAVKPEVLHSALNETMNALRLAELAVSHFTTDTDGLERGSTTAISVAYLMNRLTDARHFLAQAEREIGRLMHPNSNTTSKRVHHIHADRLRPGFLARWRGRLESGPD